VISGGCQVANIPTSIPGKFAVERYPALKYIPSFFAPWKADVLKQRQMDIELYTQLLNEIRDKTARGVCPPCFAKHGLEEQANLGMSDLELAYAMSTPFGAGIETVSDPAAAFTRSPPVWPEVDHSR
jgi:hypothetical protein